MTLKVAIIGARCHRQGTGPWFAKHIAAQDADVVAVLGRSEESAYQAAEELQQRFQITTKGFSDWDSLVQETEPDLMVIASPADTHRCYLNACMENGIPAFVEKPFVWDRDRDNVRDVVEIVRGFEKKQLPLYVNTQWLESLALFQKIYPNCDLKQINKFEMKMSPSSTGVDMLVDALPHAWNMLCELAGEGEISTIGINQSFSGEVIISGSYKVGAVETEFHFSLTTVAQQPRPFSYSINGCQVERIVDLESYSMSFEAKNAIFTLEDPMQLRIQKILTLVEEKSYNVALRRNILETQLLNQSIEASKL